MKGFSRKYSALLVLACLIGWGNIAYGDLLYSASLKNGDYGGGFQVGTYTSSKPYNRSGSVGGDLTTLGIVDSAAGVTYTTHNDVINFSLGADGKNRSTFRSTGTVSVHFKADPASFASGQPFVDNYGFDQFYSGQATFGTGMSRHVGADGTAHTSDDRVELSWNTWHNNVWYPHIDTANDEVLVEFNQWHHLGLAWGGPAGDFEVWVDGVRVASDDLPVGVVASWGRSDSAYNFALGEIHERMFGNSSPCGVTFADLQIWDEYRALGGTVAAVPEPSSLVLWSLLATACIVHRVRKQRGARH